MKRVLTGLDILEQDKTEQKKIVGKIGLLCHTASVNKDFELSPIVLKRIFGERLIKLFGPQHGFATDVQDNMIETGHTTHSYFNLPVYSLYSETRVPTDEMLEGIDTFVVDLQDVGTRIYTYISTLGLLMEKCEKKNIKIVILDRPNPIGGNIIEGNIRDERFKSFVGHHNIPMRHGMTLGEVALYTKKYFTPNCMVEIVKMKGWKRTMPFADTHIPWVNPSPNLPTAVGTYPYVGTVLFEGTSFSEGRGTTRSLEIVGHPKLEPYAFKKIIMDEAKKWNLSGFELQPIIFVPTFHKHAGLPCGGYHIHPTDIQSFRPWRLGQLLCRLFSEHFPEHFQWKEPPYEYEYEKLPIDILNGTDLIRKWIKARGPFEELVHIEEEGHSEYLKRRKQILIYK